MNPLRWLVPRSLFGRAVLTLIFTFALIATLSVGAVVYYTLIPVAQRSADDLVAFILLSGQSWATLPPNLRPGYAERVRSEHQIWLHRPDGNIPQSNYFLPYVQRVEKALQQRLGSRIPVRTRVIDDRRWFFVDLNFGPETLRIGFPRDRIATRPLTGLIVVGLFTFGLVLLTAAVLARRITKPLNRLGRAAREVAQGRSPEPLPETGPRELSHLARQFNHMARQVQELLANRTTLLSGISHDLRTPITRLHLALEMLPPETDPQLVRRMQRDLEQMNELISESLAVAHGLDSSERREVDLSALVEELAADRPRVRWHSPGPCPRQVNPAALRRILINLLENALRYGGDEPVAIELECAAQRTRLRILDRGPGIPDEYKESVFRPFYRLEVSRSRSTGGSGLGLAVVRQLAEGNNLCVWLEDRDGGGTVAWVELGKSTTVTDG